jgi:hypothetical protein
MMLRVMVLMHSEMNMLREDSRSGACCQSSCILHIIVYIFNNQHEQAQKALCAEPNHSKFSSISRFFGSAFIYLAHVDPFDSR